MFDSLKRIAAALERLATAFENATFGPQGPPQPAQKQYVDPRSLRIYQPTNESEWFHQQPPDVQSQLRPGVRQKEK